jgi:hypothetical protein
MVKASATSMTSDPSDSDEMGAFMALDFSGDNLDPEALASLIPLRAGRPTRKGQRLGSGDRIAKTGYCGFSTLDQVSSKSGDAHLAFLLEIIEGSCDTRCDGHTIAHVEGNIFRRRGRG